MGEFPKSIPSNLGKYRNAGPSFAGRDHVLSFPFCDGGGILKMENRNENGNAKRKIECNTLIVPWAVVADDKSSHSRVCHEYPIGS